MTIDKFHEWISAALPGTWDIGSLKTGEQRLALYPGRSFINPKGIGQETSYRGHAIRILVHWNKNVLEGQIKAQETYNYIRSATGAIDSKRIIKVDMRDQEAIFMGADDSGVFEFVIDCEIIMER
ncbi:hypothetical protein J3A84_04860 [Proteiniclasticum sp. SCR006]|uniref:Uncharacterized protein n=1 Tax=Proteiniclasticum aestuarii TaxID=2817862 RepID=A0A939HAB2_9CLOT|nr:hypothetical protein [Proteiniclasticum aestuarii]MBO1264371.1 hypothetical protein [Proteiniclasticum aestuarii]